LKHNAKHNNTPALHGPKAPREQRLDVMLDKLADLVVDHLIDLKNHGIEPWRGTGNCNGSDMDVNTSTTDTTRDRGAEDTP